MLFRFIIFGVLVVFTAICVLGQDLGSSNKIFTGKKKKTKSIKAEDPPAKKATPKASNSKTTSKSKTSTPKTSKSSSAKSSTKTSSTPKFTEFKKPVNSSVQISKAQPKFPTTLSASSAADRYEELIEHGNIARDDRNYSAAEAAYSQAKSIILSDSRAVYGLGNIYSDQQRWEDAETAYRHALQLEPSNAIAHIALSFVLTQPIAAPNLSERYEEAEKLARRAIEFAPQNALAHDQLGVSLELRGLIRSETENAYRKAIQLDPSFAPAYAHLGRLLRRRGLNQESEAAYKSAIQRSTDVATMILVADVMQSEQRYADSEPLLRKALESDPKNPSGLFMLGRALTTQSKFIDAERVLRTSLSVSPNTYMANSLLASLYTRQGKLELAENSLLQALRSVSPMEKRSLAYQFESVGDGYLKSGKAKLAERTYRQAMALDPEKESLGSKLLKAQRG